MRINGTVWSARDIAARIDHTVLAPDATRKDMENACALARAYGFKAVFTNPYWTPLVAELLDGSGIAAGISAAFPLGSLSTDAKVAEVLDAVARVDGKPCAVDMVTNIALLKEGHFDDYTRDIAAVVNAVEGRGIIVKAILETSLLNAEEIRTACRCAAEAGVDDFLSEATPEAKLALIRQYQAEGRLVAMTGDGTNDAPALAQANVGLAMNSGTTAAKEAANMVDLDSSPTKLIEIVRIGKQLLMTRGSLTTFSIANDVAKYFAIIPALFMGLYPQLSALNIMGLHSSQSAVLSAIIYNALIIIALIPLALKGVKYREVSAGKLLSRNLLIYGLGGLIAPFIFIKLIDVLLVLAGVV